MTTKATFYSTAHNPDVLSCIANLSNDEVFTPPRLVNQMLDDLENAWADSNNGELIWSNSSITFLDPCTKSGVFLREIVQRLIVGQEDQEHDLSERVDRILRTQVFGIGITNLTALLARRSVYCSKFADGTHSVFKSAESADGNVWFDRVEHTWIKGKCEFCGASEREYARDSDLETYAYAFLHEKPVGNLVAKLFGGNVNFDVVIGNPPYQLGSDGGTRDVPIYQRFVDQARALEPRFISMVIPARWMAGGLGLGEFRKSMLSDRQLRSLIDYPVSKDVFPSVEVKGGICIFLWERGADGPAEVTTIRGEQVTGPISRDLGQYDIFVRDSRALEILEKVLAAGDLPMSDIVSSRTAFGVVSNFKNYFEGEGDNRVRFYATSPKGRIEAWIDRSEASIHHDAIDTWKAMVPKAGSDGGQKIPDIVLGQPWVAENPSICTQSFLFVSVESEAEAQSVCSYYRTRFLRFLVSLRKITQDTTAQSYLWVPQQTWDRTWSDEELFTKYSLSEDEVEYISSVIKPMELEDG